MARKEAEIKLFEGSSRSNKTFALLRKNLFTHTQYFCAFADAKAAVFVFSKARNAYAFGHPTLEAVVGPFLVEQPSSPGEVQAQIGVADADGDAIGMEDAADSSLKVAERRLNEAFETAQPAWDVATKDLGLKELGELEAEATEILILVMEQKNKVSRRRQLIEQKMDESD